VVACRLLQPNYLTTYEHTPELRPSHLDDDRNRLRVLFRRGDLPLARDKADVPRATQSAEAPSNPLSPVKAWRIR